MFTLYFCRLHRRLVIYLRLFVRLSVSRITEKLWMNFDEMFELSGWLCDKAELVRFLGDL